jgi:hypothetical protein
LGVTEFSGIRTFTAQPLLLSFINTTLNAQTGTLTLVISTNTAFEFLYFTYYWWINGPILTFSSGNSMLAYQYLGIGSINGSQLTYDVSGFNVAGTLSCNGMNCPSACVSSTDCQSFKGVIAGQSCFLCGNNQTYVNGNCQNTFICNDHQFFNGLSCECSNGYFLVNGACLPSCGDNAYVDANKQCQCLLPTNQQQNIPNNLNNNIRSIQNIRGFKLPPGPQNLPTPIKVAQTCNKVKICGTNQIFINNAC